jgi:chromosome segregation ATPase
VPDDARSAADPLEEPGESEGLRDRISARTDESVGDLLRALLETPGIHQALQAAFGARDIATNATGQAMKNLNVAAAGDLDRLSRRLRSLSDRLEGLEDSIDQLSRDVAELRGDAGGGTRRGTSIAQERLGEERLGLTE